MSKSKDILKKLEDLNSLGSIPSSPGQRTVMPGPSGITGVNNGHKHSFSVNNKGDGTTQTVDGHFHVIKGFEVLEADSHTHSIKRD